MTLYNAIQGWQHKPTQLLAVGRHAADHWTAAQWLHRVACWRTALLALPAWQKVAVFLEDSAEFSALLFALWSCQRDVWLAPNNLPATVEQLRAQVDGFAGQFAGETTVSIAAEPTPLPPNWRLAETEKLTLFTSGSSGEAKAVAKLCHQLAAEVAELERCFGGHLQGALVLASVSHQHVYGLLFRVLWPLAMGRSFARYTLEFLEDARHYSRPPYVLVSSPTHLARLPEKFELAEGELACIFSSGAPLSGAASLNVHRRLGCDLFEVLGSTETGGIAWRTQYRSGALWQPFDAVHIAADGDGLLVIRSPYLPHGDWYACADRVQLRGGQFELLGRADRIVKIEGKRVALEQVERHLLLHSWVADVRVQPVSRASTVAVRDELVVLLVLSSTGAEYVLESGRKALLTRLSEHLADVLERPLLPRRWRLLAQLPRNSQGKMLLSDLDALLVRDGAIELPAPDATTVGLSQDTHEGLTE